MLRWDRPRVISFAMRFLLLFAVAVGVFEVGMRLTGRGSGLGETSLAGAFLIFVVVYLVIVLIVSVLNGWISFSKAR